MHFSCDLCGKGLIEGSDARYVVNLEVHAAHDPTELTEEDLDSDHLEDLSQMLSDDTADTEPAPTYKKLRFDLCSGCHKKFLADPLGREMQKFDFSQN